MKNITLINTSKKRWNKPLHHNFFCSIPFFIYCVLIFPTAPTMSAVGKEPHLSSFSFSFFRGPLLDWLWQIMLYSHWSTQTWRSTNACVPATDEAVVCTLMEPSNAGAYWAMPHSDILAWLISAARKIFISGVSSQIPLIQDIEPSNAGA